MQPMPQRRLPARSPRRARARVGLAVDRHDRARPATRASRSRRWRPRSLERSSRSSASRRATYGLARRRDGASTGDRRAATGRRSRTVLVDGSHRDDRGPATRASSDRRLAPVTRRLRRPRPRPRDVGPAASAADDLARRESSRSTDGRPARSAASAERAAGSRSTSSEDLAARAASGLRRDDVEAVAPTVRAASRAGDEPTPAARSAAPRSTSRRLRALRWRRSGRCRDPAVARLGRWTSPSRPERRRRVLRTTASRSC